MKAIILAGGFGTRLRPMIGDEIPKCMAPVMGRPIITYIINRMKKFGITDITLALHYKAEKFIDHFGDHLKYLVEKEPLGTGGAIKNCMSGIEPVLVANGDTISVIDYSDMLLHHTLPLTIAVTHSGESAGTYIVDPEIFDNYHGAFSFEKDVIPNTAFSIYIVPDFTDIGTPEVYAKVPKEWI